MERLVQEINKIAIAAGKKIMEIYQDESLFGVEVKKDESPLTIADTSANKIICDGLLALTPEIPIISEENKLIDYQTRKSFQKCWVVDPLDGTKEFIKRNGEFTVNIALLENNIPVLGVVYVPAKDELYYAANTLGAFRAIGTNEATKITNKPFGLNDEGLKVVCSRSHLNEETQSFIDKLNKPEKVAKGSSLKFLALATGEAHIYPRIAPTMEWDTCAAQVVLEQAGGKVVKFDDESQVLDYNKENLLNPYFVAYGPVTDHLN